MKANNRVSRIVVERLKTAGLGIESDGPDALTVDFSDMRLSEAEIRWITHNLSAVGRNINLNLSRVGLGDRGVEILLTSGDLSSLVGLDLFWNSITDEGVERLAASPQIRNLTRLNLGQNSARIKGAKAIADSKYLTKLTALNLYCNHLTWEGVEIIGLAKNLQFLEELILPHNQAGDAGVVAITSGGGMQNLKVLDLRLNFINNDGVNAIARSTHMSQLEVLDLSENTFGNEALIILARSAQLPRLTDIRLEKCYFNSAGAVAQLSKATVDKADKGRSATLNVQGNRLEWIEPPEQRTRDTTIGDLKIASATVADSDARRLLAQLESSRPDVGDRFVAARVTMAGVGMTGKTSLSRFLVGDPQRYDPITAENRTIGIDPVETAIDGAEFKHPELGKVKLTVLDCGGQQEQLQSHHNLIYKAAERSVFILCLNAGSELRTRDGNRADYYLRMLQSYHASHIQSVPVIVVVTQADKAEKTRMLPEDLPREFGIHSPPPPEACVPAYPLLSLRIVDSFNGRDGTGLSAVQEALVDILASMRELRALMPKGVIRLRDALEAKFATPECYCSLTPEQFIKTCNQVDLANEALYGAYLRHLACLGTVIAPGVEKTSNANFVKIDSVVTEIFNPLYINRYVYGLLMNERLRTAKGFMSDGEFRDQTSELSENQRQSLKSFLIKHLVAFAWNQDGDSGVLVPDLLPERRTPASWQDSVCGADIVYSGVFLDEGRFFKCMASFREQLKRLPLTSAEAHLVIPPIGVFRNECCISKDGCDALIQVDVIESRIKICLKGDIDVALRFRESIIYRLVEINEMNLGKRQVGDRVQVDLWEHRESQAIQQDNVTKSEEAWARIPLDEQEVCKAILIFISRCTSDLRPDDVAIRNELKRLSIRKWHRSTVNKRTRMLRNADLIVAAAGGGLKLLDAGTNLVSIWEQNGGSPAV